MLIDGALPSEINDTVLNLTRDTDGKMGAGRVKNTLDQQLADCKGALVLDDGNRSIDAVKAIIAIAQDASEAPQPLLNRYTPRRSVNLSAYRQE